MSNGFTFKGFDVYLAIKGCLKTQMSTDKGSFTRKSVFPLGQCVLFKKEKRLYSQKCASLMRNWMSK